jgi:hypothetical protein
VCLRDDPRLLRRGASVVILPGVSDTEGAECLCLDPVPARLQVVACPSSFPLEMRGGCNSVMRDSRLVWSVWSCLMVQYSASAPSVLGRGTERHSSHKCCDRRCEKTLKNSLFQGTWL